MFARVSSVHVVRLAATLLLSVGLAGLVGLYAGVPALLTPNVAFGILFGVIAVILLAALSLARTSSAPKVLSLPSWLPLAAGLVVAMIGVLLWQALVTSAHSQDAATRGHMHRLMAWGLLVVMGLLAVALTTLAWFAAHAASQRRDLFAAETRSRHEAAVLQQVLDVLPVGVWLTEPSGAITSMNPAGRAIWHGAPPPGATPAESYKAWWPDTGKRVAPDEWPAAHAAFHGAVTPAVAMDIECFDGARKTILNAAAPLIEDGRITGVVGVVQDITHLRHVESALLDRTRELERSNADLEQFAYVASHDLQEPLRMVSSFTQLLASRYRGRLDGTADEYVAFIVDGATRMQRLLEDLLEYSRVGTRGRPLQPVDARLAVRDAVDNLALVVEERRATVNVGPLPVVLADRAQLSQLVQNLVANALKFAADGRRPHIDITATAAAHEVVLTVTDNGIGIDAQNADRIFDIFRRLDTSGRYPGTGLGLAICKRIVSRHGGRIWVESTPGRGSAFHFTLQPAVAVSEPLEQTA